MPRHGNVAGFLMAKPTILAALRFNLEISSDSFDPVSAFELSAFPGDNGPLPAIVFGPVTQRSRRCFGPLAGLDRNYRSDWGSTFSHALTLRTCAARSSAVSKDDFDPKS